MEYSRPAGRYGGPERSSNLRPSVSGNRCSILLSYGRLRCDLAQARARRAPATEALSPTAPPRPSTSSVPCWRRRRPPPACWIARALRQQEKPLLDRRIGRDLLRRAGELVDDRARRRRRQHESGPRGDDEILHAGLGLVGASGRVRPARGQGLRESAHFSGLDERDIGSEIVDREIHRARQHGGNGLRRAAEWHVHGVESAAFGEQHARQMRGGADPGTAEADVPFCSPRR